MKIKMKLRKDVEERLKLIIFAMQDNNIVDNSHITMGEIDKLLLSSGLMDPTYRKNYVFLLEARNILKLQAPGIFKVSYPQIHSLEKFLKEGEQKEEKEVSEK